MLCFNAEGMVSLVSNTQLTWMINEQRSGAIELHTGLGGQHLHGDAAARCFHFCRPFPDTVFTQPSVPVIAEYAILLGVGHL